MSEVVFKKIKKETAEEKKVDREIKLSDPWFIYNQKVKAMFKNDPEIEVSEINEIDKTLVGYYAMFVTTSNIKKYYALNKILKDIIEFGDIKLRIGVVYSGDDPDPEKDIKLSDYEDLFNGNDIFNRAETLEDPIFHMKRDFVVFNKKVIQYYSDNLSDINCNTSTLAEEISKSIFNQSSVLFCTDNKD